jgi:hypothetical protein
MPRRSAGRKLRIIRRNVLLPFVTATLLLLPLALTRSCENEVRIDVTVSEIAFDIGERSLLIDAGQSERLYVVQSASAMIRRADGSLLPLITTGNGALIVQRPVLSEVVANAGTRVTLARTDRRDISLSFANSDASIQLSAPGQAVACDKCRVDGQLLAHFETTLEVGDDVVLRNDQQPLHVVITREGNGYLGDRLQVSNLAFVTGKAERPASSLLSDGSVSFPNSGLEPIPLRRFDTLALRYARRFSIDTMELAPQEEGLHVVTTGRTRELLVGNRNRLPSALERLHANQTLSLYFAALVFVAATAANVIRKLRLLKD